MQPYPALTRRLRTHAVHLKQKKQRWKHGQLLLEGARLIGDALSSSVPIAFVIVASDRVERQEKLLRALAASGVPVHVATPEELETIADTEHSQGLVAVAAYAPAAAGEVLAAGAGPSLVTALSAVADPGNLGTMLRTSDWFGVRGVLLSANSVDPTNPKVIRATMGSFFRVRIGFYETHESLLTLARERGYSVAVTAASGGVAIDEAKLPLRTLLVFGSEAHGLSSRLIDAADLVLTIPSLGGAESLNLAIAHGIFLSHLVRRP